MSDVVSGDCVASIIRTAGGEIVGRTRLQKVTYLLQLVGYPSHFRFEYYHYGPYCEELASSANLEDAFGTITEQEKTANWGGKYSIYEANKGVQNKAFSSFAQKAANSNAIELELAATAAYLAKEEACKDPWVETARRKPEKAANGRLENAKKLYKQLAGMDVPRALPDIV